MNLRAISQINLDRLSTLNSLGRPWKLLQWSSRRAEVIALLGESAQPGVSVYLLRHALDAHTKTQVAARQALTRLLSVVPVECFMELDAYVRELTGSYQYNADLWSKLSLARIEELSSPSDSGLLAFASMHPNGYGRETAVRVLAQQRDGSELGPLLLRVNDWVAPVREAARAAILSRIQPNYAHHFLTVLPLVLQLGKCLRVEQAWLTEAVGNLFTRPECEEVLQAGLSSAKRNVRLTCLQYLQRKTSGVPTKEFTDATRDPDSMIRFFAARTLMADASADEAVVLQKLLKGDHFMPVRREALNGVVRHGVPGLINILKEALLDQHASMRDLARFYLKNELDVTQVYREALKTASGWKLVAVIRGLGECGAADDAEIVATYLQSPLVRVRAASILALGRLAPKRFESQFIDALADPSVSISCSACKVLLSQMSASNTERLTAFLSPQYAVFTRRNALRLVSRLTKWDQISVSLRVCRDPSESISTEALRAVRGWLERYNKSFIEPSESQVGAADQEFRSSQEFLDRSTCVELEALFRDVGTR